MQARYLQAGMKYKAAEDKVLTITNVEIDDSIIVDGVLFEHLVRVDVYLNDKEESIWVTKNTNFPIVNLS